MLFFHPRWPIFYEDNHLLVLYKPAGLIMQRDRKEKPSLVDLAKQWLKQRYTKPGRVFVGMVHRLDAPVAGVLALARTSKAAARLSAQFREGGVEKTYLAVVEGRPRRTEERLVHHLERRGRFSRPVEADKPGSQTALLSYRLLDTRPGQSLLEIDLDTGRRHQIRAQLAAIGCPICGDVSYGAGQSLPHGCIALLARRLKLTHPTLKTLLTFESPTPEAWPWPLPTDTDSRPLWAIEAYHANGLMLPNEEADVP
jgi:23S rRNA pseudouridine1911/1915/1917 synthase